MSDPSKQQAKASRTEGGQFAKGSTGNPAGRKKGVPNKVTKEFREVIQALLHDNADNVALWLKQTAEGSKSRKVNGKTIPGRAPNPEGAARLLGNLAEFAAPRLSRAEVTGAGGGALTVVVRKEP